mgnify:CR=1 FL=1
MYVYPMFGTLSLGCPVALLYLKYELRPIWEKTTMNVYSDGFQVRQFYSLVSKLTLLEVISFGALGCTTGLHDGRSCGKPSVILQSLSSISVK